MKHYHLVIAAAAMQVSMAFGQQTNESAARRAAQQASPASQPLELSQAAESARNVLTAAPVASRYGLDAAAIDAGRVVAVQGARSQTVTADNIASTLVPGVVLVERVRTTPLEADVPPVLVTDDAPQRALRLGYQLTVLGAGGDALKLDTWAREGTGLLLDGGRAGYVGDFYVALTNAQAPGDRSALASPMPVAVTAAGAASIDPKPFEIAALGRWQPASILVPAVDGDTYTVSVSADPNGAGDSIELVVSRPTLSLSSRSASIVGWGIGQSTISLQASGALNTAGLRVPLRSTAGTLETDSVTLDESGHGSTRLRSSGSGVTEVTVARSDLRSGPLTIQFTPPWLFLGSAVAGGLAGAFLQGKGRQRWPMALAIGVVSAVVMTLAYAIGMDWLKGVAPWVVDLGSSGEAAAVIVLGAIGALVGVGALVPGTSTARQ